MMRTEQTTGELRVWDVSAIPYTNTVVSSSIYD
jgi:hypothetical protein